MTSKKIAVLGGGNGAHTMAAEFAMKGHTVNLYEMPQFKNNMKKVFETKTIKLQGNIKELQGPVELNMVTDDISALVLKKEFQGEDLFPFEKIYHGVLECGLAIVNPVWHAGPVLSIFPALKVPR
ncbi:MAG: hypothetical protein IJB84_02895 [Lachnospiraceae bacterium]|nr:hypothetical protein [Lachnospiraceae bacterium]